MLVHCSDGWDRTSQLAGLAQLILDKHYRTIEGFEVLIEKDFVSMGHQLKSRLGHGEKDALHEKEFCPVFIQYLDCVYQIMQQFPRLFEFNSRFLLRIAHHAFSLRFGTFLCNCDRERRQLDIKNKTTSLWSYLNSHKEQYLNPLYCPEAFNESCLYPDTLMSRMKLWEELYLKWSLPALSPQYELGTTTDLMPPQYEPKMKSVDREMMIKEIKETDARREESERRLAERKQVLDRLKKIMKDCGVEMDQPTGFTIPLLPLPTK